MTTHGLGGIFFKCKDPKSTAAWYEQHLGVARDDDGYTVMGWRRIDGDGEIGETVFAPFPADTDYFGPGDTEFMINLRVDDLDATLAALEEAGVELAGDPQTFDYGKFGWCVDCDGRKVELWEPPRGDSGFTITVPQTSKEMAGEWLSEPGSRMAAGLHDHDDRCIRKTVYVPLDTAECWRLWTTSEGIAQWLVTENSVELRIGGPYEFYFNADGEPGARGGEGNKVLSFLPNKMLSFSWNAPPHLEHTRRRYTHVVLEFESAGDATKVTLNHLGWPAPQVDDHAEWQETFEYFQSAWPRVMHAFSSHATKHANPGAPSTFVGGAEAVLPAVDVGRALQRYERLGFTTEPYIHDNETIYGFVCMGTTSFHVTRVEALDPAHTTSAIYCYVDDADSLYETWSTSGADGRFHAPEDTPYGLREFAWVDPDGNLFRVGSPLDE